MNTKILYLIKESKNLLAQATPEQKIKFLKLLKESLKHQQKNKTSIESVSSNNTDYLQEK